MHTFIISSNNISSATDYVLEILDKEKINKIDISIIEKEKALGIEDVRQIQRGIYLKPMLGEKKAIVVILLSGATLEAQSSMLKILEEPPASTLLYIVIKNHQELLPTILSRAKIIELEKLKVKTNSEGYNQISSFKGIGDKMQLAQSLAKDKKSAIDWLEDTIVTTREKMLSELNDSNKSINNKQMINNLNKTLTNLKTTNTNPRLALENLFLNI